jgi:Mg-chelatase subunit ChlD
MSAVPSFKASLPRRFIRDPRGSIGLIFGLSLAPIMGLVGATIDYSRTSQTRNIIAMAADAAALEGAKSKGTEAERRLIAEQLFKGNIKHLTDLDKLNTTFAPVLENGVEVSYRVTVSVDVLTSFTKILGVERIPVVIKAEAKSGRNERLDVAFVLDTTDSMAGDRLATLKTATTSLITEFEKSRATPDQIRVGVVPFGQYVNIGLANRTQPWLDVAADYQLPDSTSCRDVRPELSRTNCRRVTIPAVPAVPPHPCTIDGRPRMCGGSPAQPARHEDVCDITYGPPQRVCTTNPGRWIRWRGCVGSRNAPLNTLDSGYTTRIPGIMDVTCGSEIREMTTNLASARTAINGLTTRGLTYIPSGLIWGWRMLSEHAPLAGRASTAEQPVRRYMILVTDGQNTKSASFPRHDGNSTSAANATMATICSNMALDKTTNVKLYTIAFQVDDPTVKTLLETCSNQNGGKFYDAADAQQLVDSLKDIGSLMTSLRLSH